MRKTILLSLLLFLSIGQDVSGQTNATFAIKNIEQQDTLKYFIVGDGCPPCNITHPENQFGFTIQCAGSILTKEIENNNKEVSSILNKKNGSGWTEKYLLNYCIEKR